MLQQDTLFANRYQLRSLIGRGGFSEVWLAHDTWTDLDIAIKVYAPGQGLDSDGLKEFCQELAGVHHLTHPNLLKPDHVDQWENMPYLIMEYCPKGALNKQVGKLSEEQVWKVLHDVAAGLAYLHSKDIVHQDIKPDNILLDESGNYRITDFGISTKARTTLRKSMLGASTSGGTMAYMGPERFSAQPAPTKASDIWSLGAMIYELITGDVPFGEIGGGMQKNGAEIPDIAKPISLTLTHVIHLMLAKETWDRPTAEMLATWAANPSLVKVNPADSPQNTTSASTNHSEGGRPTAMFNSADLGSKTNAAANSTLHPQRPTQRVVTPPAHPKPVVKTPDTPNKPKRNKGILIFFITLVVIVGGAIAISSVNNQKERQAILNNHNTLVTRFDNAIKEANIDNLESLGKALDNLQSIRGYENNPKYSGFYVYSEKKNILKAKTNSLHDTLWGKYHRAPIGTSTEANLKSKLDYVSEIQNQLQ